MSRFFPLKSLIICLFFIDFSAIFAMAPFTVDDVIVHAATLSENYNMEYLQSDQGRRHVKMVIDNINKGVWPRKDGLKSAWNTSNFSAGYNKSLVADHVSQEYKRMQVSDETILKHLDVMRSLKKRTLEKQTALIDAHWAPIIRGKSLDEIQEYLEKTVTGKILIKTSDEETLEETLDVYLEEAIQAVSSKVPNVCKNFLGRQQKVWALSRKLHEGVSNQTISLIKKTIKALKKSVKPLGSESFDQIVILCNGEDLKKASDLAENFQSASYFEMTDCVKQLDNAYETIFGKIPKIGSCGQFDPEKAEQFESSEFYKLNEKMGKYFLIARQEALAPWRQQQKKVLNRVTKQLIENEIKYNEQYFSFYHAQKGSLRFAIDVITEFANYFSVMPLYEVLSLRMAEKNIPEYMQSITDYLCKFYEQRTKNDHSDFARKTLLAVNLSPLSFHNTDGESTLGFFIANQNIADPSLLKEFLLQFLKDENYVIERLQKYQTLFDRTIRHAGASILQILIKKEEADLLVYPSVTFGHPVLRSAQGIVTSERWSYGKFAPESKGLSLIPVSECLLDYVNTPIKVGFNECDPRIIQGRIIMNMSKFLDAHVVKIKRITAHDIGHKKLREYYDELAKLVQEDILYYLRRYAKKNEVENKLEKFKSTVKPRYTFD